MNMLFTLTVMTPVASLPEQHETNDHRWKLITGGNNFRLLYIVYLYHLSVPTLIHPKIHLVPSHNDMHNCS